MSEPINLNKARKERARADAKVAAARNRVAFGRTKAETALAKARSAKAAAILEGARREPQPEE